MIQLTIILLLLSTPLIAKSPWQVEGGLTVSHFQQQVKTKAGGPRGDRLVNEYQVGVSLSPLYRVLEYLSLGLFLRGDVGTREVGTFTGFDSEDKATTDPQLGGAYSEFWIGPLIQSHWKIVTLDLGYALWGIRDDEGRGDIFDDEGGSDGLFSTSSTVAYLLALGVDVPVSERLGVVLKLEYRVRYYDERGGRPLMESMDHGTMSLAPLMGISWNF